MIFHIHRKDLFLIKDSRALWELCSTLLLQIFRATKEESRGLKLKNKQQIEVRRTRLLTLTCAARFCKVMPDRSQGVVLHRSTEEASLFGF